MLLDASEDGILMVERKCVEETVLRQLRIKIPTGASHSSTDQFAYVVNVHKQVLPVKPNSQHHVL